MTRRKSKSGRFFDLSPTVAKRIYNKIKVLDGEDGCWIWTGATNPEGYGNVAAYLDGRIDSPHRVTFMMYNLMSIPEGKYVCHTCDNPSCCNPNHLYLGSPTRNQRDRRERTGEYYPGRVLTRKQIKELVSLSGTMTQKEAAERYGISARAVRRHWRTSEGR